MATVLAFLNIGATEIVLVAVLFVLLFGADKLPAVARTLGKVQGEWARAKRDLQREMRTEEERQLDELYRFERARELQIRQSNPEFQEEQRVREAARALGIADADTATLPHLRGEIRERLGSTDSGTTGP